MMATLGPLDEREIDRYAQVLSEIKARMLEVEKLDPSLPFPDVEIACLHLRIVLEAIVMSSLVANQHAVGAVAAAFDKGDVGQVRKVVKRVNPDYWPRPVRDVRKESGTSRWEDVDEGFLMESDWGSAYGLLSAALHARNPFGEPLDAKHYRAKLHELHAAIARLLQLHLLTIAGHEESFVLCGMLYVKDQLGVSVTIFERVEETDPPRADVGGHNRVSSGEE